MKTSKINLPAKKDSLKQLNAFVENFFNGINIPLKVLFNLNIIIEEIAVNIFSYAYPNKDGKFSLELFYDNNEIILVFEDSGIEFDPTKKENNIPNDIEEASIGGLGISIVKQLAKNIEYKRIANKNILKIVIQVGE